MLITKIKRDGVKKKVYVYADGEYLMSMDLETFISSGIKEGACVDFDEIKQAREEVNFHKAKDKALRLLGSRSHSKKELLQKIKRTYDEDSSKKAVERMEKIGLVNDENFAKTYAIEMFNRKYFSVKRVEYELFIKGIDKDVISRTIEDISPDEDRNIISLLEGKFKGKFSDEKGWRRTVAALQRLGYNWEQIKSHMRELSDP